MSNQLINRTKELSLLGWSEEGARRYSELVDNNKIVNQIYLLFPDSFSESQIQLALFITLLILIFSSILLARLYNFLSKNDSLVEVNTDAIIVQKEIVANTQIKPLQDMQKVPIKPLRNIKKVSIKSLPSLSKGFLKVAIKLGNNAVEFISLDRKNKIPFVKYFSTLFEETSVDTDSLIQHGLLATLLTYEASRKALKSISIAHQDEPKGENFYKSNQAIVRDFLISKDDQELRNLLKDSELLPVLRKEQLIDLIVLEPTALKKANFEARKAQLQTKTVVELKTLLKGVNKISSLRKSELIDRVLLMEYEFN